MLDCLINWLEFNSSWLAPLISAFAAVSSFRAAISAKKAAKSNRVTALGQIVNVLEREYESNEMMAAIHRIKGWKKEEGLSWIENFIERKNSEDPSIQDVDEARRMISNYFYRYCLFLDLKIIDMKMMREIVGNGLTPARLTRFRSQHF